MKATHINICEKLLYISELLFTQLTFLVIAYTLVRIWPIWYIRCGKLNNCISLNVVLSCLRISRCYKSNIFFFL